MDKEAGRCERGYLENRLLRVAMTASAKEISMDTAVRGSFRIKQWTGSLDPS